jgi:hypothetical protein
MRVERIFVASSSIGSTGTEEGLEVAFDTFVSAVEFSGTTSGASAHKEIDGRQHTFVCHLCITGYYDMRHT